MGSVASDLKSERQRRNVSLAQIAADTRISLHYLESLEEGRYNDLPGGMYNRAFLRAYCERLNLNQQEILNRYEAEISPPPDRLPKSKIHIHSKDTSLKPSPVLIWSLMLLFSATGLFFSRKWIAAVFSPYFSRKQTAIVPRELVKPPAPSIAKETPSPSIAQIPATENPSLPTTIEPPDSNPPAPPAASVSLPANQTAVEPGEQTVSSQALLKLEIAISQKCWVSIDRDGNRVFRRIMEPGEAQSFSANEQFLLIVGNAGGIHLKINGKPAKPLGKSGEVVRILIDEKNLKDLLDQTAG